MSKPATKRDFREESIQRHMRRCRHFNGTSNGKCEVGVSYDTVREPGELLVCIDPEAKASCSQCSRPTREEAEALQQEQHEAIVRIGKARAAIVEATGGKRGVRGAIDCPCCQGGRLSYSVAGINGHIWAGCSTKGCVSWME